MACCSCRSCNHCSNCQQAERLPGDYYCRACRQAYSAAWRRARGIPERRRREPRPEQRIPLRKLRAFLEADT